MASPQVVIDLMARDRASAVLDKAGRSAEKSGKKFGGLGKVAGLAGAAAGVMALKFGKDSVAAFKEAEQSSAALDLALKKFPKTQDVTRASLDKLNMAMAKKTMYDDDAFASGQAVLAQFSLTGKQIQQLTPLMADYAARTGKDIPTAATDLGKAFNGSTKALKALGINYKATGDKAKDQAAITDLLREKVGGAAEAMGGTAAGKAKILENQYGELQEAAGKKLVPALTKTADVGLRVLDFISRNSAVIGPLVAVVGTLILGIKAWTMAQAALNVVMALNPIGLVVLAIAALATGMVLAYQKSESFRDIVNGAFRAVGGVVLSVVEGMLKTVRLFARVSDKVFGTNFTPTIDKALAAVDSLQKKLNDLGKKPIQIDVRASVLMPNDLKVGRRYASGTSSAARGLALVGEEGPEIVRFGGGEQVVPAGPSRRILGGGGGQPVTITLNGDMFSAKQVRAMLLELKRRTGVNLGLE